MIFSFSFLKKQRTKKEVLETLDDAVNEKGMENRNQIKCFPDSFLMDEEEIVSFRKSFCDFFGFL